jgi:molecular chaperone HtpG
MTTATDKHEFSFQAEIKQLLHLLSHSLYQSREIAVRELVSNASDALDKMRYIALTDESQRDAAPLEISIEGKPDEKLLIIRDNGIGMTREELVTNLGTIAHSGSRDFLKNLAASPGAKTDLSLIGQFGVGFYASFMVADRVAVRTRSYSSETGWEWESDGSGTFTVAEAAELPRGTEIILHLKEETKELAEEHRIKAIIRKYSSFVPHPIRVAGQVVNDQKPIWVEPKSQVTEEQYTQFYQHLTHHTEEKPLWHLHTAADSPIQFRAILYCPPTNIETFGFGRLEHGLSLCAKRVLVQSDCRELVPDYFRFLYGLVDSEDLPLNVSRETLQDNTIIRKIRNTLIKGVIDRLHALADESPEKYLAFYSQFGTMIKEGVAQDFSNRERLAKLLRFPSSHTTGDELTSLDDYLKRAGADQKPIYFLGGPDLASIRKSPSLEIFRKRGIEVLYLAEPIDEFVMSSLNTFEGHALTSVESADLDLPGDEAKPTEEKPAESSSGFARVLDLFKSALGDRVKEVRESKRLTDSPCCLVNAEGSMTTQMHRLLRMANRDLPPSQRIMEINPSAPLVRRLSTLSSNHDHDAFIKGCALQLWANALILEGVVPEPQEMVARVESLLEQAAEAKSPLVL